MLIQNFRLLKKHRHIPFISPVTWCTMTLMLCSICSSAQESAPIMVNFSYIGNTITHPGLKLGVEYPLTIIDKDKTRNSGKAIPKRQMLFVTGNLSATYFRRFNTTSMINGEVGYRRIRKKGSKVEVLLGVGALRTFVDGDTYQVSDQGEIERVGFAGQWGWSPSLSFGFGKDLGFKQNKPWAYHIKPSFYFQMPYNHSYLLHFVLEAGITYKLSSLLKK